MKEPPCWGNESEDELAFMQGFISVLIHVRLHTHMQNMIKWSKCTKNIPNYRLRSCNVMKHKIVSCDCYTFYFINIAILACTNFQVLFIPAHIFHLQMMLGEPEMQFLRIWESSRSAFHVQTTVVTIPVLVNDVKIRNLDPAAGSAKRIWNIWDIST